jgi:hypothetical protein
MLVLAHVMPDGISHGTSMGHDPMPHVYPMPLASHRISHTLHVIIIPGGGPNVKILFLSPPGAAKHEMEQFRRMEMVDLI